MPRRGKKAPDELTPKNGAVPIGLLPFRSEPPVVVVVWTVGTTCVVNRTYVFNTDIPNINVETSL